MRRRDMNLPDSTFAICQKRRNISTSLDGLAQSCTYLSNLNHRAWPWLAPCSLRFTGRPSDYFLSKEQIFTAALRETIQLVTRDRRLS